MVVKVNFTDHRVEDVIADDPPDQIPLIIGDFLQNLRSSLDYLVWELCIAAKQTPSEKHQFPICDTPTAFEDQLKRGRLKHIDALAVAEIKGLQPYHYRQGCALDPLRILDNLCNINKHRRILITTWDAELFTYGVPDTGDQPDAVVVTTVRGKMQMKAKISAHIAFKERVLEGYEIGTVLIGLSDYVVGRVLPAFERFFV